MRLKLIANNTTVERRFSAWIGGSILASLVSIINHTQNTNVERQRERVCNLSLFLGKTFCNVTGFSRGNGSA